MQFQRMREREERLAKADEEARKLAERKKKIKKRQETASLQPHVPATAPLSQTTLVDDGDREGGVGRDEKDYMR